MDMDDDMRNRERIQKMIAALQENSNPSESVPPTTEEKEAETVPKEQEQEKEKENQEVEKVQFKLFPSNIAPVPPSPSVNNVIPKK